MCNINTFRLDDFNVSVKTHFGILIKSSVIASAFRIQGFVLTILILRITNGQFNSFSYFNKINKSYHNCFHCQSKLLTIDSKLPAKQFFVIGFALTFCLESRIYVIVL